MTDREIIRELKALARESAPADGVESRRTPRWAGSRGVFSRAFVVMAFVGLAIFLVWASRAELEQVVRGQGQVIPHSSTQVIQSLEGGIVSELRVKVGDRVEKGDVLLRLHDKQFASQYQENLAQSDVLQARRVRLRAEAQGSEDLRFPEDVANRRPDIIEKERLLFDKRRLDERTKAAYTREKLAQAQKKLAVLSPAIKEGSISQLDQIELETEILTLKGQLDTMATTFAREAMEQYDQEIAKLEAITEAIKADQDRLERATIRSPVTGTVNAIFAETEGRVVRSGDAIMEVVPEGETALVEAQIPPADIAFLNPGQEANVRFTAYDFATYGGLGGIVETIGVNTVERGPREEKSYPIRVRTSSNSLGTDRRTGEPLVLRPGMVAEVDILTGRRTVLEYLLQPIERARQRALRER
jgi:membrane fusion protein, adhesin transport system